MDRMSAGLQPIYTSNCTFLQAVCTLLDHIHSDKFSERTSTLITQKPFIKNRMQLLIFVFFDLGTQTALKTSESSVQCLPHYSTHQLHQAVDF